MVTLLQENTSAADAMQELTILEELGLHRHIISLVDRFELDKEWAFVLELAEGGEVFDRICEKGAFSEADAAVVVRHVALALAYMHSIGVVRLLDKLITQTCSHIVLPGCDV